MHFVGSLTSCLPTAPDHGSVLLCQKAERSVRLPIPCLTENVMAAFIPAHDMDEYATEVWTGSSNHPEPEQSAQNIERPKAGTRSSVLSGPVLVVPHPHGGGGKNQPLLGRGTCRDGGIALAHRQKLLLAPGRSVGRAKLGRLIHFFASHPRAASGSASPKSPLHYCRGGCKKCQCLRLQHTGLR